MEAAKEKDGTVVALSALLTTTMTMMKAVIEALEKAGIREKTKVMIGGAPITQQYADEIGADGYSDNASTAVALARRLAESVGRGGDCSQSLACRTARCSAAAAFTTAPRWSRARHGRARHPPGLCWLRPGAAGRSADRLDFGD